MPQPSNLPLIPLQMFAKTEEILAMSLNRSAQRRKAGVALWREHCISGEKAQGAKDLVWYNFQFQSLNIRETTVPDATFALWLYY